MLTALTEQVFHANCQLPLRRLVICSWGNVSGIDRESGVMIIKPSGIDYQVLRPEDLVRVYPDGRYQGKLRPSSDTATHLALYQRYPQIGAIVHTHSTYATAWAQAGLPIPVYGTTHADDFYGDIPCSRALSEQEIAEDYEKHTGEVIIETLQQRSPLLTPAVIVAQHGPFVWGTDVEQALHKATVLEEVAKMAWLSHLLNPQLRPVEHYLQDKHFLRKHGKGACYGQP